MRNQQRQPANKTGISQEAASAFIQPNFEPSKCRAPIS